MLVKKVSGDVGSLADPGAPGWAQIPAEEIALSGTRADSQPSPYIQVAWKDRKIGQVGAVSVKAAHDGRTIAVLLQWRDPTENRAFVGTDFVDAAGILFPQEGDAPLAMGSQAKPVRGWYWRAGGPQESVSTIVAAGMGTVTAADSDGLSAQSAYEGGQWRLVIRGPAAAAAAGKAAFAVWDGANSERAGLKAVSGWQELKLEA